MADAAMITRAYQNSKNERQEVTLSVEAWEAITEVDLEVILGFGEKAKEEPVPEKVQAPVRKRQAK